MNRDFVVVATALILGGAGIWGWGWMPFGCDDRRDHVSGRFMELCSWRYMWLAVVPAALALGMMLGWGLQEPLQTDEPLGPLAGLFVLPVGVVWMRAARRACAALRLPKRFPVAIATVGALRPRVVLGPGLEDAMDSRAMAAAIAHECCHVRHRDPLRIWLAQVATDLQWPSPYARKRFERWLQHLELARDEEARRCGARGEDLAAAIVAVIQRGAASLSSVALLTGGGVALENRIRRLLAPVPPDIDGRPALVFVCVTVALVWSACVGFEFGDAMLRSLPFVAA